MKKTESELKPCPFCGSSDVKLQVAGDAQHIVVVECGDCNAQGPTVALIVEDCHSKAAALWNDRLAQRLEQERVERMLYENTYYSTGEDQF